MFRVYESIMELENDFQGLKVGNVFDNQEEAQEYLDDSIPGIRACRFLVPIDYEAIDFQSEKIQGLKSKIEAIKEKQAEYNSREHLQDLTCDKYTCPSCESKIRREIFLTTHHGADANFCPVCGEDLRPSSYRKRNEGYSQKITDLCLRIEDTRQEIMNKDGIKEEQRILVKC